jgi:hypothetical protein
MKRTNASKQRTRMIWIGATVLVAAGLTTYAVVRRRRTGVLAPPVQGGTGPQQALLVAARRRLCLNPDALTADQREILLERVFAPLVLQYTAGLPAQPGPDQVEVALNAAAVAGINQTCTHVTTGTLEVARSLAHGAWLQQTGQSGL